MQKPNRPAPVQICTHSLLNRSKAESALTMLKDLGHLKHVRPVVEKNMPQLIYKVLNTCDNAVDGCIEIQNKMSPHMCLLLAGIRLFRGIRQPRWFLICKQTKAEANSYFSFCLTIFSGPKHFLSHCTFNMASGEFRPKVDMMI